MPSRVFCGVDWIFLLEAIISLIVYLTTTGYNFAIAIATTVYDSPEVTGYVLGSWLTTHLLVTLFLWFATGLDITLVLLPRTIITYALTDLVVWCTLCAAFWGYRYIYVCCLWLRHNRDQIPVVCLAKNLVRYAINWVSGKWNPRYPVIVEETEEEWLAAMPEHKRKAIQMADYWRQLDVKQREDNERYERRKQEDEVWGQRRTIRECGMPFAIKKYGEHVLIANGLLSTPSSSDSSSSSSPSSSPNTSKSTNSGFDAACTPFPSVFGPKSVPVTSAAAPSTAPSTTSPNAPKDSRKQLDQMPGGFAEWNGAEDADDVPSKPPPQRRAPLVLTKRTKRGYGFTPEAYEEFDAADPEDFLDAVLASEESDSA